MKDNSGFLDTKRFSSNNNGPSMTEIMDTETVELTADFPFLRLLSFIELQIFQKVHLTW